MIKESFRNVSCFFVFGYLQVFLREVIASASLDAFAESSVAMKQAIVSGMSHVMVKLFAPWVSWKVLPYSGKIALLFVLHTVALLIIVVANSPASRLVGVVSFFHFFLSELFMETSTWDLKAGYFPQSHTHATPLPSLLSLYPVLCPIYWRNDYGYR